MDARLFRIRGRRPSKMLREDCPALAKAILDVIHGVGRAHRSVRAGIDVISISSPNGNVVVRGDDWEKIVPYLEGLAPSVAESIFGPEAMWTNYAPINADGLRSQAVSEAYTRILAVLVGLFPDSFPTNP